MKNITKDKLLKLGFTEEIGYDSEFLGKRKDNEKFYYYVYDVNEYCILISDSNNKNDGKFTIEFFDFYGVQITRFSHLKKLIEILKENTINS